MAKRFSDKQRAAYWKAKYLACRADLTAHQRVNSGQWKKKYFDLRRRMKNW